MGLRWGWLGVALLLPCSALAEPVGSLRLLLHGRRMMADTGVGLAAWVLAPNVTVASDRWLVVAGGRYEGDGFWVEVLPGMFIQRGDTTPVLDVRASLGRFAPISAWTNLEWIDPTESETTVGYAYLMINYALPGQLAALGVETENLLPKGRPNDWSAGPQVVLALEPFALIVAYQLHDRVDDQLWIRLVLNP